MNCTACGAPLLEDAKFCNKCGQPTQGMMAAAGQPVGPNACPTCGATLLPGARFCNKCGAAVGAEPTPQLSGAPGPGSQRPREPKRGAPAKVVAFGLLGGLAVAVVAAIAVAAFFMLREGEGGKPQYYIDIIQESMERVLVLKMVGDGALASGTDVTVPTTSDLIFQQEWGQVGETAPRQELNETMQLVADGIQGEWTQLASLTPPPQLFDYYSSVLEWESAVYDAAWQIGYGDLPLDQAPIVWGQAPAEPAPFTIALTEAEAGIALQESVIEVMAAKGAGDEAVANNYTVTMLFVAAQLQVQDHFLRNMPPPQDPPLLEVYQSVQPWVSNLSQPARQIVSQGWAGNISDTWWTASQAPPPFLAGVPCPPLIEPVEPLSIGGVGLGGIIGSPEVYISPLRGLECASSSREEIIQVIQGGGEPIGGTGITQGEEPPPEPPWFQPAVDQCHAIGGRVERSAGSYAFSCYYGTALATQCIFNVDEAGNFYPDPDPRCEPGVAPPPPPELPPELEPILPPELTSGGDLEAFADACVQVNGIYPGLTSQLSGSASGGYTCVITASVEGFSYSCSITLYPSGDYDFACG